MNQSNQNESMRAMLEQVHDVLSHYCIDMPDSKKYNELGRLTADIRELFNDIDEGVNLYAKSSKGLMQFVERMGGKPTGESIKDIEIIRRITESL